MWLYSLQNVNVDESTQIFELGWDIHCFMNIKAHVPQMYRQYNINHPNLKLYSTVQFQLESSMINNWNTLRINIKKKKTKKLNKINKTQSSQFNGADNNCIGTKLVVERNQSHFYIINFNSKKLATSSSSTHNNNQN